MAKEESTDAFLNKTLSHILRNKILNVCSHFEHLQPNFRQSTCSKININTQTSLLCNIFLISIRGGPTFL